MFVTLKAMSFYKIFWPVNSNMNDTGTDTVIP